MTWCHYFTVSFNGKFNSSPEYQQNFQWDIKNAKSKCEMLVACTGSSYHPCGNPPHKLNNQGIDQCSPSHSHCDLSRCTVTMRECLHVLRLLKMLDVWMHVSVTYLLHTCKPIMYNEFCIYTHKDSAILVSNTKERLVKWSLFQLHLCCYVCTVLHDWRDLH